jgi:hypothetical protein
MYSPTMPVSTNPSHWPASVCEAQIIDQHADFDVPLLPALVGARHERTPSTGNARRRYLECRELHVGLGEEAGLLDARW